VFGLACTPDWSVRENDASASDDGGDRLDASSSSDGRVADAASASSDDGGDGADLDADLLDAVVVLTDGAEEMPDACATADGSCSPLSAGSDARTGDDGGDGGGSSQTDPCTPSPCAPGLTCGRSEASGAACAAPCATRPAGCQLGEICAADGDCRKGGDGMATCDAASHVCVTICSTTTILSQVNLDAARYCLEIRGDLILEPAFATIGPDGLPYLASVTGDVTAASVAAVQSVIESVTLPALETIGGDLGFGSLPNLKLVSLPRLAQVGGALRFGLTTVQRISLPQLTSVGGDFSFSTGLNALTQVEAGNLSSVGGALTLFALCRLPWTHVQHISTLGTSQTVFDIGCCTTLASYACVNNICTCE
jgi:hypothetical protein